jgi:hypothetical protein
MSLGRLRGILGGGAENERTSAATPGGMVPDRPPINAAALAFHSERIGGSAGLMGGREDDIRLLRGG